jgi:hypothetical protein
MSISDEGMRLNCRSVPVSRQPVTGRSAGVAK